MRRLRIPQLSLNRGSACRSHPSTPACPGQRPAPQAVLRRLSVAEVECCSARRMQAELLGLGFRESASALNSLALGWFSALFLVDQPQPPPPPPGPPPSSPRPARARLHSLILDGPRGPREVFLRGGHISDAAAALLLRAGIGNASVVVVSLRACSLAQARAHAHARARAYAARVTEVRGTSASDMSSQARAHAQVSGTSAGGLAALMHVDWCDVGRGCVVMVGLGR